MLLHVVYCNQLLRLGGNDARDVFLQLVIVFRPDDVLPALNRKNNVYIDLGIGVGHDPKMPLLTELENLFLPSSYKDVAPTALDQN